MGVRYVCDGCGELMPDGAEVRKVGVIKVREYCKGCAEHAEEYMKELNEAHTDLCKRWGVEAKGIRERFRKLIGNLPDTP